MFSYTLTFKDDVDRLTAPEQEVSLQSPAQAGDFLILSDGSRHQVMFVTHRANYSSLYLERGQGAAKLAQLIPQFAKAKERHLAAP